MVADDDIATGAIGTLGPDRGRLSRPLKRWRVLVIGWGATTLRSDSPGDELGAMVPNRHPKRSDGPVHQAAPAD